MDTEDERQALVDGFKDQVERDELDIYTCISLGILAEGHLGQNSRRLLLSRLPLLLVLQVGVPMALVMHQIRTFIGDAEVKDIEFRVIGTAVFVYSAWNMYQNAVDECRVHFLNLSRAFALPMWGVWPAVLGELINACCGFSLVFTLWTVFLRAPDPFSLLANTVAINFIGNVDNEILDDQTKETAMEQFLELSRSLHSKRAPQISMWSKFGFYFREMLLFGLRDLGTAGMGVVFAILFALQHMDILCSRAHFVIEQLGETPICGRV